MNTEEKFFKETDYKMTASLKLALEFNANIIAVAIAWQGSIKDQKDLDKYRRQHEKAEKSYRKKLDEIWNTPPEPEVL